jgi:pimeloyl-ACP methyl ester carboxylesterase
MQERLVGPREITTPFRPIPLEIPEGMKPNEFFNSTENLADLANNNGLLVNPEHLLLYRKALGHSNTFDASIIYNTSQVILDPLGRPVRRTQVPDTVRLVWNRMNALVIAYMLEQYPDPAQALVLAGEASLDATWPLTAPGVPSIRMLHNHFIVFPLQILRNAPLANPENPNLTDGGQHSLFQAYMRDVYREFFTRALPLQILRPISDHEARLEWTGYPQGLPSWEVQGGAQALHDIRFWREYDAILQGFLDFYRTFFSQVSTRNAPMPEGVYFPQHVEEVLLFNHDFLKTAKKVRDRCITDARYANSIRWQPAFKQLIYRNEAGRLIVTISQNSIGNAITELLGVVVNRRPDAEAYAQTEPALIAQLLEVRRRLVEADLGTPIATRYWSATEGLTTQTSVRDTD